MNYSINRAVVVGAGTMGAAIAAHLANAGVRVSLLDIVPRKLTPAEEKAGLSLEDEIVRNRIVQAGFNAALKAKPANFFSNSIADMISLGNLEDDFYLIGQADWIIEAIVENLDIKRSLFERVDAVRKENSIVSSNTSGIPIQSIAEGMSESFQEHFLGVHFFNPPRYLKLLEIIPTAKTLPAVQEFISKFCELRLGKGIVVCNDTPNFIGNRIYFLLQAHSH